MLCTITWLPPNLHLIWYHHLRTPCSCGNFFYSAARRSAYTVLWRQTSWDSSRGYMDRNATWWRAKQCNLQPIVQLHTIIRWWRYLKWLFPAEFWRQIGSPLNMEMLATRRCHLRPWWGQHPLKRRIYLPSYTAWHASTTCFREQNDRPCQVRRFYREKFDTKRFNVLISVSRLLWAHEGERMKRTLNLSVRSWPI
jgi:hypothetical protein